jgi:hypothetical protein
VGELEARLRAEPFHAPEADELSALQLGARELAAAERAGRVLRLRDGVVLLPTAPALAMRELARLEQPFPQAKHGRRLARLDGSRSRCWNTWTRAAGPVDWTPVTARSCADLTSGSGFRGRRRAIP